MRWLPWFVAPHGGMGAGTSLQREESYARENLAAGAIIREHLGALVRWPVDAVNQLWLSPLATPAGRGSSLEESTNAVRGHLPAAISLMPHSALATFLALVSLLPCRSCA